MLSLLLQSCNLLLREWKQSHTASTGNSIMWHHGDTPVSHHPSRCLWVWHKLWPLEVTEGLQAKLCRFSANLKWGGSSLLMDFQRKGRFRDCASSSGLCRSLCFNGGRFFHPPTVTMTFLFSACPAPSLPLRFIFYPYQAQLCLLDFSRFPCPMVPAPFSSSPLLWVNPSGKLRLVELTSHPLTPLPGGLGRELDG